MMHQFNSREATLPTIDWDGKKPPRKSYKQLATDLEVAYEQIGALAMKVLELEAVTQRRVA